MYDNDSYQIGEKVLKQATKIIIKNRRKSDTIACFDTVILPLIFCH